MTVRKIFDHGNGVTCWQQASDYFVYQGVRLIRVVPSIGMAREVAASL